MSSLFRAPQAAAPETISRALASLRARQFKTAPGNDVQISVKRLIGSNLLLIAVAAGFGATAALAPVSGGNIPAAFLAVGALCIAVATARRASRAELHAAALEEQLLDEHSYQVFIDNAIEGFFRTTRNGDYLKVNPALARIYGYETPEQLAGELTAKSLYVEPSRREEFHERMRKQGVVSDFISEIRRRDGTTIWIVENARTVRDEEGQFLFYEGTVEDITVQLKTEETLRRALAESQEAARAKVAFLSAMSHELKTPLNAVIGFSDLILHETFGPIGEPRYRSYIGDIHDNGRRLLAMINDVLDLTRVEGKLIELEEETVALADAVSASADSLRESHKDAAEIDIEAPQNLPYLRGDAKRVRQVLTHILSNAIKFTPADGKISVRCWLEDTGELAVCVRDTGIGMAEDRIAQALEPFKQLDNRLARRFEGVGIGLPLAQALVKLHGGVLTIDSAQGSGTAVTITFPPERTMPVTATGLRRAAGAT